MSGHQQTIYTIHESQLNNNGSGSAAGAAGGPGNNGTSGQRNGNQTDILIDTSSIPLSQQQSMPPMQQQPLLHHHQQQPLQAQQQYQETITSQPVGASTSAKVAPENQSVVYSVHPIFDTMLDSHDTLLIRQKADCTSTCCGFESTNTYTVRSKDGSPILKAIENSNCCERCCFEADREYNLSLVYGDEIVARIRKPYRVSRFCCYSNAVRIESPEDNPIGYIKQMFTLFGHPRYAIYDCQQSPKTPSFYIESSSCRFCCTPCLCVCICGNKQFRIISIESKEVVGTISRHWQTGSRPGNNLAAGNIITDPDPDPDQDRDRDQAQTSNPDEPFNQLGSSTWSALGSDHQLFGIQMAPNLEARHKVLLLSACFMMDFFYFENDRRRRKLATC